MQLDDFSVQAELGDESVSILDAGISVHVGNIENVPGFIEDRGFRDPEGGIGPPDFDQFVFPGGFGGRRGRGFLVSRPAGNDCQ